MTIGEKIKLFREKKKISQRELGRRINKTGQFISLIEQNKSSPSVDTLYAISQELGLSTQDFFADTDPNHQSAINDYINSSEFETIVGSYVLQSALEAKAEIIIPFIKYINDKFLKSEYDVDELLSTNANNVLNHEGNYDDLIYLLRDVIENRLSRYKKESERNKQLTY